jgi:hypothetical protein
MNRFKITSFAALRGEEGADDWRNHFHDMQRPRTRMGPPPQEPAGWVERTLCRLMPALAKREAYWRQSAAKLQADLLVMTKACEDAGRIGLALYAENEVLRQRADQEEGREFVPASDLVAAQWEIATLQGKLKTMTEKHSQMCEEHRNWLNKFWAEKS